jgi:ribosomal protein S12 methylthiotransferase
VLALQQQISLEKNQALVGKELTVLIESRAPLASGRRRTAARAAETVAVGRSYRDAPEVDGSVLVSGDARPGDRLRVRVTAAQPYDLIAVPVGQ